MTPSARDHERVGELLGRPPRGAYEVVVRDADGDPVVLCNAPLLDDGTARRDEGLPKLYRGWNGGLPEGATGDPELDWVATTDPGQELAVFEDDELDALSPEELRAARPEIAAIVEGVKSAAKSA